MPLCNKCRTIMPPAYMYAVEKGDGKICAFCKTDKNTLTIEHEDGIIKKVTKQEIAKKYEEYTKDIVNNPEIMKKVIRGEV